MGEQKNTFQSPPVSAAYKSNVQYHTASTSASTSNPQSGAYYNRRDNKDRNGSYNNRYKDNKQYNRNSNHKGNYKWKQNGPNGTQDAKAVEGQETTKEEQKIESESQEVENVEQAPLDSTTELETSTNIEEDNKTNQESSTSHTMDESFQQFVGPDGIVYTNPDPSTYFQQANFLLFLNICGKRCDLPISILNSFPESPFKHFVYSQLSIPLPYIFVDRNPNLFDVILDFVRHGKVYLNPSISVEALIDEAEFYGLKKELSEQFNQTAKFKKQFSVTLTQGKKYRTSLLPEQKLQITSVKGEGMLVGDFYDGNGNLLTEGAVIFDSLLHSISLDRIKLDERTKMPIFTFAGGHSYELYTKESQGHKVGMSEKKSLIEVQCELITEYLMSERME